MFPQSLFARTALLIAATLAVFSVIAWQAIVWTTLVPAAQLATTVLTQRANEAIAARRSGQPLPESTRFEAAAPLIMLAATAWIAMARYAPSWLFIAFAPLVALAVCALAEVFWKAPEIDRTRACTSAGHPAAWIASTRFAPARAACPMSMQQPMRGSIFFTTRSTSNGE